MMLDLEWVYFGAGKGGSFVSKMTNQEFCTCKVKYFLPCLEAKGGVGLPAHLFSCDILANIPSPVADQPFTPHKAQVF